VQSLEQMLKQIIGPPIIINKLFADAFLLLLATTTFGTKAIFLFGDVFLLLIEEGKREGVFWGAVVVVVVVCNTQPTAASSSSSFSPST
jgi:hypothetical protein